MGVCHSKNLKRNDGSVGFISIHTLSQRANGNGQYPIRDEIGRELFRDLILRVLLFSSGSLSSQQVYFLPLGLSLWYLMSLCVLV